MASCLEGTDCHSVFWEAPNRTQEESRHGMNGMTMDGMLKCGFGMAIPEMVILSTIQSDNDVMIYG
jgi:hypothetical protein